MPVAGHDGDDDDKYVYMDVYIRVSACLHELGFTYLQLLGIYIYIYIYIGGMCVYVRIYIGICMYMCMHKCVCIYIYIIKENPTTFQPVRFLSQLRESSLSSQTEESWYNETVCLWMTINICSPIPVGLSFLAREINGYHKRKARLFKWISFSVVVTHKLRYNYTQITPTLRTKINHINRFILNLHSVRRLQTARNSKAECTM